MIATATVSTPRPATPPAAPAAAQPTMPGAASFSQLLNDQPAPVAPPPDAAAPTAPDSPPAQACAPAPAPARGASSTSVAQRRKEAAPANATGQSASQADAAAAATGDADTLSTGAVDKGEAGTEPTDDPDTTVLDEFTQLIGLPATATATTAPALPQDGRPASALAAASAEGAAQDAAGAAATAGSRSRDNLGGRDERSQGRVESPSTDRSANAEPASRAADPARTRAADAASARQAAAVAASDARQLSAATDAAPRTAASQDGNPASFAAMLAQSQPGAAQAAAAAPAPVATPVHAALHSPVFAPELSAHVSLMAVNGVQQAELQLNPAEMGPVAVQITVDGGQAQVSFHAAHAETRQVLEQSLPDLAAALQGQGLTLSGGGVFQQPSRDAQRGIDDAERSDGPGERGSRMAGVSATASGSAAAAAAAASRRSVGLLDTFA